MDQTIDWGSSYHGLSAEPFSEKAQAILQAPIPMNDVEVKPDGIVYLPEIKYRRILNSAFGPGGWGLAPRGELHVGDRVVTREFALVVGGRYVLGQPSIPCNLSCIADLATDFGTHPLTLSDTCDAASSLSPEANAPTTAKTMSPTQSRAVSPMLSPAVAKTWVLPRSCGTLASYASITGSAQSK